MHINTLYCLCVNTRRSLEKRLARASSKQERVKIMPKLAMADQIVAELKDILYDRT